MRNIAPYVAAFAGFLSLASINLHAADLATVRKVADYAIKNYDIHEIYQENGQTVDSKCVGIPVKETEEDIRNQLELIVCSLLTGGQESLVLTRKIFDSGRKVYVLIQTPDGIPRKICHLTGR